MERTPDEREQLRRRLYQELVQAQTDAHDLTMQLRATEALVDVLRFKAGAANTKAQELSRQFLSLPERTQRHDYLVINASGEVAEITLDHMLTEADIAVYVGDAYAVASLSGLCACHGGTGRRNKCLPQLVGNILIAIRNSRGDLAGLSPAEMKRTKDDLRLSGKSTLAK